MVNIDITYEGGLHCSAVHGPSGVKIETDAPEDNHGKGESFSPTDLFSASLGVCMVTIMGIKAQSESIELKGTAIKVEKHMSSDLPRRVAKLVVRFELPEGIPADRREALESAALNCPVAQSISPGIEVDCTFNYKD